MSMPFCVGELFPALTSSGQLVEQLVATCSSTTSGLEECTSSTSSTFTACCIFLAKLVCVNDSLEQSVGSSKAERLTLSDILRQLGLSWNRVLQELPEAFLRLEPQLTAQVGQKRLSGARNIIRDIQSHHVYINVLYNKCKGIFRDSFVDEWGSPEGSPLRFCWLMYVVCKARILTGPLDLVSSFNLLLCVANVCMVNAPLDALQLTSSTSAVRMAKRPVRDFLSELAQLYETSFAELQQLQVAVNATLTQILDREKIPFCCDQSPGAKVVSAVVIPSFCERSGVSASLLAIFDSEYATMYREFFELDEREVLCPQRTDDSCATSVTTTTRFQSSTRRETPQQSREVHLTPVHSILSTASPCVRSRRRSSSSSPIGQSVSALNWLRTMVATEQDKVDYEVHRYFEQHSGDIAADVATRSQAVMEIVFPVQAHTAASIVQPIGPSAKRHEALVLYYRLLVRLLQLEEHRSGTMGVSALLSAAKFHNILLACCCELVAAAYKMVNLRFPTIIQRLNIPAFDLYKMVEQVAGLETSWPPELKRHLSKVEEKILESLAWEHGSPLFELQESVAHSDVTSSSSEVNVRSLKASTQTPNSSSHKPAVHYESPVLHPSSSHESHPGSPVKRKGSCTNNDRPAKAHKASLPCTPTFVSQRNETFTHHEGSCTAVDNQHSALASATSPLPPLSVCMSPPSPRKTVLKRSSTSAFSPFKQWKEAPKEPAPTMTETCSNATAASGKSCSASAKALLKNFRSRMVQLAARRVSDMSVCLDFSPRAPADMANRCLTVVQHIVYNCSQLMHNRHLDQMILCSMYGVCKVYGLQHVTFNELIQQYKRQPQAGRDIYKAVIIQQETNLEVKRRGDILEFYNTVYLPVMTPFLLSIQSDEVQILNVICGIGNLPSMLSPGKCISPVISPMGTPTRMGPKVSTARSPPRTPGRNVNSSKLGPNICVSPMHRKPWKEVTRKSQGVVKLSLMLSRSHLASYAPFRDVAYLNDFIHKHASPATRTNTEDTRNESFTGEPTYKL